MTKPELGTKRLCSHCGAKFYDLHHSPITCPKCDRVFEPIEMSSRFRTGAAHEPKREAVPLIDETPEAESGSLEDADAGLGEAPQAEDVVEPDDEVLDDAVLIEESEQGDGDVTEITGDDIDVEEGN